MRAARLPIRALPTLALIVLVIACANMSRQGCLDWALRDYMEGNYQEAVRNADLALSFGEPTPEDRARATLLKGQSLEKLGDVEAASGLYHYLVEQLPQTPEAYQARQQLQRLERRAASDP